MLPLHRQDAVLPRGSNRALFHSEAPYNGDKSRAPPIARQASLLARKFLALKLYQQIPILVGLAASLFFLLYWLPRSLRDAWELQRGIKAYRQIVARTGLAEAEIIPVLIPCYGRPAYLKQVLESLEKANNIDKTVLIFSQDGHNHEVEALIDAVNFTSVVHLRHNPPYWGLPSVFLRTDAPTASNVFFLLTFAFDWLHVPAAIVLESDIVISPDGLDYFRWAWRESMRDPALRDRLFTVNGYYEDSQQGNDPYTFTTHEYGFMVWGWLCPGTSWRVIKAGFTWFGNWDITMENSIRRPSDTISVSPVISRTRNIGMQGINFDIRDESQIAKWTRHYIPTAAIEYTGKAMDVIWDDDQLSPDELQKRKQGKRGKR